MATATKSFQTEMVVVTVLYGGPAARDEAQLSVDRLTANLGGERIDKRFWRFDMLSDPELAAWTADDAREADILLVATEGSGPLPALVEEWLNEVMPRLESRQTCVAHLRANSPSPRESEADVFLTGLAECCGHDYFSTVRPERASATTTQNTPPRA